jgi:hypothetical protein
MKEKDFRGFVTKRPLGAHAGWFTTVSGRAGGQRTAMFRRQLGPIGTRFAVTSCVSTCAAKALRAA